MVPRDRYPHYINQNPTLLFIESKIMLIHRKYLYLFMLCIQKYIFYVYIRFKIAIVFIVSMYSVIITLVYNVFELWVYMMNFKYSKLIVMNLLNIF